MTCLGAILFVSIRIEPIEVALIVGSHTMPSQGLVCCGTMEGYVHLEGDDADCTHSLSEVLA